MPECPAADRVGKSPAAEDWLPAIRRAIAGHGIHTDYQPIVDLKRATIVGYEALTRFSPIGGWEPSPDCWFEEAYSYGLGAELNAAALKSALKGRSRLPRNCFLSVNIDPDSLFRRDVLDVLNAQGSLTGLVIEITEHRPWEWAALAPVVSRLRSSGALFAVDDAGAGYAGLQQILQLRPQILKLDRALIEDIDRDEAKVALVEMLGLFANRIDAWVLAEGIETFGEARRLIDLQVPLVQGFYFARPSRSWSEIAPGVVDEIAYHFQASGDSLHRLVDPIASISRTEEVVAGWVGRADPWIPVVDEDRRPLGLINAHSAFAGELVPALVVNVHSSAFEVANRVRTADDEPHAPIVVADNGGRYLGLISIRRLISAIACQGEAGLESTDPRPNPDPDMVELS